jgi:hypothetical protein
MRFNEHSAGRVGPLTDRLVSREIDPYVAGEKLLEGIGA